MFSVQHFEIAAEDESRAQEFYGELFGWEFESFPDMDYTMIKTAKTDENQMVEVPGAINGGMFKKEPGTSGPVIVISVDDTAAMLDKVEAKGGMRLLGPEQVGDFGIYAQFTDPEGNLMGLWQSLHNES